MLRHAKRTAPEIPAKSGMMLGLGETKEEIIDVMRDLHAHQVDIVTLGQYLRPSRDHVAIHRYYAPQEFFALKRVGEQIGFRHVEAGPLVRSSYHADACV
jgi:lipoic acid synthetase